ncbi:hypothetical protein Mapa_011414 [Marchantia paleacea]|nr:hypothetical protein Mapa_011414 [Marchantia paleacea]
MATATTARSLLKKSKKCSTGCRDLDSFLRGGFPCGSVTELVGESASAKTQLCLQLSLAVQLPASEGGLNGSSLYVYTENYFPFRRLQEIANHMVATRRREGRPFASNVRTLRPLNVNSRASGKSFSPVEARRKLNTAGSASIVCEGASNPCNRVFVQGIQTADNLLEYLDYVYTLLIHPFLLPVKVIVIDSIAALFRSDFDNTADEMKVRVSLYFQVAAKLKKYAEEFNLAVVVTNQVTDSFEPEMPLSKSLFGMSRTQDSEVLVTSGRRVAPALALSWTHCINSRLFLSRSYGNGDLVRRSMQVVFAPHLPTESCDFEVNSEGVRGLSMKLSSTITGTPPKNRRDPSPTSYSDHSDLTRIPVTPPRCDLHRSDDCPSSCDRLFEISQSQRVVETPPYTPTKRKVEVTGETAHKENSITLQLKLFR